ncbi:MAG: FeoA family protein [Bacillales bacterium]
MTKILAELQVGEKAKIVKVTGEGKIRRRLFDMGLTPGCEVFLRKKAPLGDPIELNLRGYELSLRKDEAKDIVVEVIK